LSRGALPPKPRGEKGPWFLILIFFLGLPTFLQAQELGLLYDPVFKKLAWALEKETGARQASSGDLCRFKKLVVLGPEAAWEVSRQKCPLQKRYFVGILFPDLFGIDLRQACLISPLPRCPTLRRRFRKAIVIYSPPMEYYVQHLSTCLSLRKMRAETFYELPSLFQSLSSRGERQAPLLLLPDPLFLNRRGMECLQAFLKKYPRFPVFDLLGLPSHRYPSLNISWKALLWATERALEKKQTGIVFVSPLKDP